jgi:hypothetical protein
MKYINRFNENIDNTSTYQTIMDLTTGFSDIGGEIDIRFLTDRYNYRNMASDSPESEINFQSYKPVIISIESGRNTWYLSDKLEFDPLSKGQKMAGIAEFNDRFGISSLRVVFSNKKIDDRVIKSSSIRLYN